MTRTEYGNTYLNYENESLRARLTSAKRVFAYIRRQIKEGTIQDKVLEQMVEDWK